MRDIFLALSGTLTIAGTLPYIRDIMHHKTKPRLVSWFNWSLLTGIATAAAIADKQWPSAVLTGTATITTMTIVIMGLRYGDTKIEAFDVICQIGAVVGLVLWLIFNSPLVALVMTVTVDFIAALPTLRHAWKRPHEETLSTFIFGATGAFFALLAIRDLTVAGLIYPVYLFLMNLILILLVRFNASFRKSIRKA